MKDYYNKKLNMIIEAAEKDGCKFIDGKFIETQEDVFPVMEMFLFDSTVYEDTGHYHIFKRTYKIEEIDYNKVVSYCKKNDGKKIHMYYDCDDIDFLDNVDHVIGSYDCFETSSCIDYYDRNVGGTIEIRCNDYYKYTNKDECVDLWFSKEEENDDFPIGYISFYKIKNMDFRKLKKEDIDIKLNKFMRDD